MLLTDRQIKHRMIVRNADQANYSGATYYLTISRIFPMGEEQDSSRVVSKNEYILEPQHMVWVVSQEELTLPPNVTGSATLVTTLTKQGILAFNVGIIDPNWHGPIGTVLVNFSRSRKRLQAGDKFFRLIFFEHEMADNVPFKRNETVEIDGRYLEKQRNEYVNNIKSDVINKFPSSFLNAKDIFSEGIRQNYLSIIPIIVLTVSLSGLTLAFAGYVGGLLAGIQ